MICDKKDKYTYRAVSKQRCPVLELVSVKRFNVSLI